MHGGLETNFNTHHFDNVKFDSIFKSTRYIENIHDDDSIITLVEKDLDNINLDTFIHDIISDSTYKKLYNKLQRNLIFNIIEDSIILPDIDISGNVDFKELYLDLSDNGKMVFNDCVTIYGSQFANFLLLYPNSIAYLAFILKRFGINNKGCRFIDLYSTHIEDYNRNGSSIKIAGGKQPIKMNIQKIFMMILIFIIITIIIIIIVSVIKKVLNKDMKYKFDNI